ncbi:MAG: hypothetical protein IKN70_03440 [Fibrobacter sp.]|nr:hypothetical protein [Fibrobacter sp.]
MSTTYAQKNAPAQKKDVSTAASVHDVSSQIKGLQRKVDMANSNIIQRYPPTPDFYNNHHGGTDLASVQQKLRDRRLKEPDITANSVLNDDAYNFLSTYNEKPMEKQWQSITSVPCATAFADGRFFPNSFVSVWIRRDCCMGHAGPHLPQRGRNKYRKKNHSTPYLNLRR